MLARRVDVGILINNHRVVEMIAHQMTSFSYTDPASDEADSLSMTFEDIDRKWLNDYFPQKLDMISGAIHIYNRNGKEEYEAIETGATILDSFSFSGHPNTMNITSISTPINSNFKSTKNSNTYEDITFRTLCSDIASRNGLKLETNVDDFIINSIEQKKQTDSEFLMGICKEYGLCMKIYTEKLIIFDREKYKQLAAVRTYEAKDIQSYSFNTQIEGTYDGGVYTYKDHMTETEIEATYGKTEGRILKASGNATSISDAEKKIKGQVLNANHSTTKLNITIMGEPIYSTQCVNIKGLGKIDGKYYIDKVSHSVSGGYNVTLDLSKCE